MLSRVRYRLEQLFGVRMDDREYIEFRYHMFNGARLDLDNPTTYVDKINWMKLYDRNPIYTRMADKIICKQLVSDKIGSEYIIPIIKTYSNVNDINPEELPDKFVLKTNHDCGGVYICQDKGKFDFKQAMEDIKRRIRTNYFWAGREWVYKDIKPHVFCEEYIENLTDNNYKFFCFNGIVKAVYVAPFREKTVDYFDRDYKHLDIHTRLHSEAQVTPVKPSVFDELVGIAEKLSEGIRAVRVDLYLVGEKIYFGEYTFYHEGGFTPFIPDKWNKTFGDWLNVSKKYNESYK